jgi:UDP-N-acetylglucosamine--N-acetylmuramyl-(pentapeptide) pyrophosphoryl-undecaprenol N-acetylglucosamine transferase
MTFLIAAAGTGGHVFPGLSVGEALIDRGVPPGEILFVGGSRLEASVYPAEGFPFLEVDMRGLQRSLSLKNLALPALVRRARDRILAAIVERGAKVTLGMGGYVTIPTGLASRRLQVPFYNSEQNARAGLANRVAAKWARQSFGAFPFTEGLPTAEWVGNPVREAFWRFTRSEIRPTAIDHYGLEPGSPVLGVVGGSLGAGVINEAVLELVSGWKGPPIQVLHLTGDRFSDSYTTPETASTIRWVRKGFETRMEWFYAASDLVVARAGGAVAELTATSTPSILVPGDFGSGGHQTGNALFLTQAGAALTLTESELSRLPTVVETTLLQPEKLATMRSAAGHISRPEAAHAIADALIGSV